MSILGDLGMIVKSMLAGKADKATTLNGYGITDGVSTTGAIMTGALTAIKETKFAVGGSSIDLTKGNVFTKTALGDLSFIVTNPAPSGNVNSFILELKNAGSYVVTWWPGVAWANGIPPVLTAIGTDVLGFYSHDGGVTWRGSVIAKDSK